MTEETAPAPSVEAPPTEPALPKSEWGILGYAMDGGRTHGDLELFYKECIKAGRDVRLVLTERLKHE